MSYIKKPAQLKMSDASFYWLANKLKAFQEKHPDLVNKYESGDFINSDKVNDLQQRFCFDCMYYATKAPELHDVFEENGDKFLTGNHIYSALRVLLPKVHRKY